MLRIRYALLLVAKQCCCVHKEQHASDHESAIFFTNTSTAKLTIAETGKEEKSDSQPVLLLKVEASDCAEPGKEYKLTALGLEEPIKGRSEETVIGTNGATCDILVEGSAEEVQCVIKYVRGKYVLADSTKGTFVRVGEKHQLQNETIVSFGSSTATVAISPDNTLSLTFWTGPIAGQTRTFPAKDEVLVGRIPTECALPIDDVNMSRRQCVFAYNPASNWTLRDGNGRGFSSQNGTW